MRNVKRIEIVFLFILAVVLLPGWACSKDGPGVHNITLSVVSQTLYGARADKIIPLRQGEDVTITITADEPMEVFVHGYDVETTVKPGTPGKLQFRAEVLGRFPLMIHSLGEMGEKHVEILLGLIEVMPGK